MLRHAAISLVVTLAVATLPGFLPSPADAADTSPPVLSGTPTIVPSTIDVSSGPQTVRIEAHLIDNVGVSTTTFSLLDASNDSRVFAFATLASGTAADGIWRADVSIPRNNDGVLRLEIYAFDTSYNVLDTITSTTLTVTGGDITPPNLAGAATRAPASIDLNSRPGDVTVTAPVADVGSGVYRVEFRFQDADSNSIATEYGERIDGTSFQGTWRAVVTLPANTPPGTWSLWVHMYDNVGNSADADCHLTIEVSGGDIIPPALVGSVAVDPASVSLAAGDAVVTIDATLSDASGIDWVSATLRNSGGDDVVYNNAQLVSGDSLSGTWRAELTIPQDTPSGIYRVIIGAADVPGNNKEFVTTRTVSVNLGDTQPPALSGTVTISPDTVDVALAAKTVTVTAVVTDAQSGVFSVGAQFRAGSSSTLVYASLSRISGDASSGTWQGTAEIPAHTTEGAYGLTIEASDVAGNNANLATGTSVFVLGGDTAAPTLSGAAVVDPEWVNVTAGSATVEARFTLVDTRSGVASALAELRPTGPGDILSATATRISGDSLSGTWRAVVTVPASTPEIVLTLWIAASDHSGNEAHIETDRHLNVTRDTEMPVTFRVDMRPLQRTGVFRPDQFTPVYLDIFQASSPVILTMTDANLDSIYEVQQFMRVGDHIRYAFAFSPGISDTTRWLYELNGRDGGRDLTFSSGQPLTLPIVTFNDLSIPEVRPAAAIVTRSALDAAETLSFNDFDRYTDITLLNVTGQRSVAFAVRRYETGGGGNLPPGIVRLSTAAYWGIDYFANGGVPSGALDLPWEVYGGVADPSSLRWLHRDGPAAPWQVVTTTLDTDRGRMTSVPGSLSGEWTVGSTSLDNTLARTLPDSVSTPNPPDGAFLDARESFFGFAWIPATGALNYDAYVWPEGQARPATPTYANLLSPEFFLNRQFEPLSDWRWQVVARNRAGLTPGPEWRFRFDTAPDLVIDQIEFPPEVFAGQEFQIRWVVRNEGLAPTNAAQWSDVICYSRDNNLNLRLDPFIGLAANGGWLAPGESYATTQNVTIPDSETGESRIFIWTDFMSQLAESNETNNTRSVQITVKPALRSDLRITRFSAPDRAFSGQPITVSWDVKNVGVRGTTTSLWVDQVYLSSDSTLDLKDPSIATSWHSGIVPQDSSYTVSITFSLPDTAIGDRRLILVTDSSSLLPEADEGISNRADRPVTITLTPPPDLVPTALSASGSGSLGSSRPVTLRWTVANQGPGPIAGGSWSDRIYLAPRSGASRSDTVFVLGSFPHAGLFIPDSSYVDSAHVRIPDGIFGSWALRVTSDWNNRVFEYLWDGNNSLDADVSIDLSPSPDLLPSLAPLPVEVTAGNQLDVGWRVRNAGPDTARASWADWIYASPGAAWDSAAARKLMAASWVRNLAPDSVYSVSALVRIPPDLTAGTWRIFVRADADRHVYEHNAEANNLVGSGAITVRAFPVDLVTGNVSAPATANSGQTVALGWQVQNQGAGVTLATSWSDAVYLSTDDVLNPATGTLLGEFAHSGVLRGGENYDRSLDVKIPDGLSGTYRIFIRTDSRQAVIEGDDTNNTTGARDPIVITLSPPADLRVESLDAPATAAAGQPLSVVRVVRNAGIGVTPASRWFDGFYLSKNALRDRDDIPLGARLHSGALGAGESAADTATISIPSYAAGNYYLIAETDTRNEVYEHQAEGNNTTAKLITIDLPPPTDLVVTGVDVDSVASPGDSVTVRWTLENHGTFPANGYMTEGVYVSADSLWTIDDPLVGLLTHRVEIAGGAIMAMSARVSLADPVSANATATVTEPLPGVVPGSYHAVVRTNIRNTIRETDLSNNTGISSDSVLVGIPVLPLDVLTSSTLGQGQARYWRIDVPESGRTLGITLTGDAASVNEMFVRSGEVPTRSRFDLTGPSGFSPDQEILIPSTSAGSYYVMVYGSRAEAGSPPMTILAHIRTFAIDKVEPPQGGNGGEVTLAITGSAMESGVDISLVRPGSALHPVRVKWVDPTRMFVTFDLSGAPVGSYDIHAQQVEKRLVYVDDPDPDTLLKVVTTPGDVTLPGAFQIVSATARRMDIRRTGTKIVRISQEFEVSVEATNLSNQDMRSPLLLVYSSPDFRKGSYPGMEETAGPRLFLLTPSSGPAGTFSPGMTGVLHATGTAPNTPGTLHIETETVETTRYPFDFDRELRNAGVDPASSFWSEAVERLRSRPRGLNTWSDYADLLAETASGRPAGSSVPHEAENLLMLALEDAHLHVLYPDIDEPIVPPDISEFGMMAASEMGSGSDDWSAGPQESPVSPQTAGPPQKVNCSEDLIKKQIALMSLAETGMIHACAPGGAYHLGHFLNGDGAPIVYTKDSARGQYVIKLVRAHTNAQVSFEEIHREVAQQLREQLEQYFNDAEDCSSPNSSPSFNLKPRKPSFYDKGAPGAIKICNLPGVDLQVMFGGMQRAAAVVKKIDMNISPFRTCKKGCVVSYTAVIEYRFGDNYEFDLNDRKEGAFDKIAYNLQECGYATRYTTEIVMEEPADGRITITEKDECEDPDKPDDPWDVNVVASLDPNDMIGPAGVGDAHWVARSATLPYMIRFENDPKKATAPAQVVTVTQTLDPHVDVRSFRLGRFGFGSFQFDVPPNSSFYSGRLDVRDSLGVYVDVNAGIDIQRGEAFWAFRSIDPVGGDLPANPLAGFLSVDDSLGHGQGFVSYTVRPKPASVTGDLVRAQARIVFDLNEPIDTPQITNAIDADPPRSRVLALPAAVDTTVFAVTWSGSDSTGSGMETSALYWSRDDGKFEELREGIEAKTFNVTGEYDHTYRFFVQSVDRTGNREAAKTSAEAVVRIDRNAIVPPVPGVFAVSRNMPNPFRAKTVLQFDLPRTGHVELRVFDSQGRLVLRHDRGEVAAGAWHEELDMSDRASGIYFAEIKARFADGSEERRVRKVVLAK